MWHSHDWEMAWGAPVKRTSPPMPFTHTSHYYVAYCPLHHVWDFSYQDSYLVYSSLLRENACMTIMWRWNVNNVPSKFDSPSHKNTCATLTWPWNVNDMRIKFDAPVEFDRINQRWIQLSMPFQDVVTEVTEYMPVYPPHVLRTSCSTPEFRTWSY